MTQSAAAAQPSVPPPPPSWPVQPHPEPPHTRAPGPAPLHAVPAPPAGFVGYAPAPKAVVQQQVKHSSHGRLLAVLGGVLGGIVALVVVIGALSTPGPVHKCSGVCPQPPTAPPLAAPHEYKNAKYGFSIEYYDSITRYSSKTEELDNGLQFHYALKDGTSTVAFVALPAQGHNAQEIAQSIAAKFAPGGQLAYTIPGAEVGYHPGYGAVYDYYPTTGNGSAEHDRFVVNVATKGDLAIATLAVGPYHPDSPDLNPHGMPAALLVALFIDSTNNGVHFPGDTAP